MKVNHFLRLLYFALRKNRQSLENAEEAMLELSKGKFTSDPANHSGEGIFFTSRGCDVFSIRANHFEYLRDNIEEDWTFSRQKSLKGSCITLLLNRHTKRQLVPIFIAHQDEDSLAFTKTEVKVDMAKLQGERLISRSQAQRVANHLEKFTDVILDFKKVKAIGQGFVDQLFRVYQNQHPAVKLSYVNASPEVEFMIKRGVGSWKAE